MSRALDIAAQLAETLERTYEGTTCEARFSPPDASYAVSEGITRIWIVPDSGSLDASRGGNMASYNYDVIVAKAVKGDATIGECVTLLENIANTLCGSTMGSYGISRVDIRSFCVDDAVVAKGMYMGVLGVTVEDGEWH